MQQNEVKEKVIEYLRDSGFEISINIKETFVNLGLTSLNVMELICNMEDEFSFRFTDRELRGILTIEDLVNEICERINA